MENGDMNLEGGVGFCSGLLLTVLLLLLLFEAEGGPLLPRMTVGVLSVGEGSMICCYEKRNKIPSLSLSVSHTLTLCISLYLSFYSKKCIYVLGIQSE
ncbi:hypothetical protein BC829DRAFT_404898 [Chytridium lagenaria]|nr:hypothetical protein BC829DRAFT_404898 [Chytridium lagenaria]